MPMASGQYSSLGTISTDESLGISNVFAVSHLYSHLYTEDVSFSKSAD